MIDLITASPWLTNMGDIATQLVTANSLASRGVPVRSVPKQQADSSMCIIGGGDLLGSAFNKHFLPKGRHCLNAVGVQAGYVHNNATNDYLYVSVRDEISASRLRLPRADIDLVPCPAGNVRPLEWADMKEVPRWGFLGNLDPKNYVVVQNHPSLLPFIEGIKCKVLILNPSPYCPPTVDPEEFLRANKNCSVMHETHSPELICTLLANSMAVLTISLHMTIISLANDVPFQVPTHQDYPSHEKIFSYWDRAGLSSAYKSPDKNWIPRAMDDEFGNEIAFISQLEKSRLERHFDRLGSILKKHQEDQSPPQTEEED